MSTGDERGDGAGRKYNALEDRIAALEDDVRELLQCLEEVRESRQIAEKLEIEHAQLVERVERIRLQIRTLRREWQQARAGMSVIWSRIKDAVSLNYDELKILRKVVRQLARIVNRLSMTNIVDMHDTGKLSSSARRSWLVALAKLMEKHFSEEELVSLAFDASLDHEAIPGETKPAIIRNMILYFFRTNEMDVLLSVLARERPSVVWPTSPMDVVLDFDVDTSWREIFE